MKEKRLFLLFLAFPIPEVLKEEIKRIESKIDGSLKWIPEKNLHITVLFLGKVSEERMRLFSRILKKLTKEFIPFILHPYSFKIQKNGFQNMVWVNFKKSPEFEELSLRISDALGYENKRKPLPHINLVRSKNKIESSLLPLVIQKEIPLGIDHVELWESHLNPKGATYFCLESFYFKS